MTTLLTNMSIIWLCSLLAYELLLKQETFHRLNRLYLLLTFIAGIVLPLLPWGYDIIISQSTGTATQTGPVIIQQDPVIPQPGAVPTAATAPVNWCWVIYLIGASMGQIYLLYDTFRLALLYRKAATERSGKWIIAQTGKTHTPFSFLNIIFVGSREQYTEQQWQMVLQHEQQHWIQKHILDLVLLQLGAIVFWFHPLVYIYRHKLRLLHEYEADQEQEQNLQVYGHFLIEQAVLGSAPAIAHSFNYSPIKKRIHMLTKTKSKRSTQLRLILLLPMMAGFICCCAINKENMAVLMQGNHVIRRGMQITEGPLPALDTFRIPNLQNQTSNIALVQRPAQPAKLNGQTIFQPYELSPALTTAQPLNMRELINQTGIESVLCTLPDNESYGIAIDVAIIAPSGQIAQYCLNLYRRRDGNHNILKEQTMKRIRERFAAVLMSPTMVFSPGMDSTGNIVPYFLGSQDGYATQQLFTIKDHHIFYLP